MARDSETPPRAGPPEDAAFQEKKTLARGPAQGRLGDAAFQQEETLARGPAQGRLGDAAFQEKKCLARGPAQGRLEDVAFQLRIPQRKPWQAMADNVAAAAAVVGQRDRALFGVPAEQQPAAARLVADIAGGLRSVGAAIDARRAGARAGRLGVRMQGAATWTRGAGAGFLRSDRCQGRMRAGAGKVVVPLSVMELEALLVAALSLCRCTWEGSPTCRAERSAAHACQTGGPL